jgi:hypothetical protein
LILFAHHLIISEHIANEKESIQRTGMPLYWENALNTYTKGKGDVVESNILKCHEAIVIPYQQLKHETLRTVLIILGRRTFPMSVLRLIFKKNSSPL